MNKEDISKGFAIELLKALYGLDRPINELSMLCAQMPAGETKQQFIKVIGDIMGCVTSDLMVPIYRRQPTLGRASEPGPWLEQA